MEMNFDKNEIYEKILEENGSIIFLADMKTHELIYMTRSTLHILGRSPDDTSYIGKPCYKILQGQDAPCHFCNNRRLSFYKFDCWEHFNPMLKRYFSVRDKKIMLAGRTLRMEIADDISGTVLEKQQLQNDLSAEKAMMLCIQQLTAAESNDQSINALLEKVCDLYEGERGYIFQFDYEKEIFANTYEWCRKGIHPEIGNLQNLPLSGAEGWIHLFREEKCVNIQDLERDVPHDSYEYRLLAPQGVNSLVAVPLLKEKQIVGFIGVDNPKNDPGDLSLMRTIAQFVSNDMEKRKILEELEKSSSYDMLSGVFNRNRYIMDMDEWKEDKTLCAGVIFLDLDNLKDINDAFGHDAGDDLIQRTAAALKDFFPEDVYRIGGDEFVVLCKGAGRGEFEKRVCELRSRFLSDNTRVSMGFTYLTGGENLQEAILEADKLMYREKAGKRNEQ